MIKIPAAKLASWGTVFILWLKIIGYIIELAKPINSNKYPPMVLFNTIAKNTSKAEVIVTVKKAFRRLT